MREAATCMAIRIWKTIGNMMKGTRSAWKREMIGSTTSARKRSGEVSTRTRTVQRMEMMGEARPICTTTLIAMRYVQRCVSSVARRRQMWARYASSQPMNLTTFAPSSSSLVAPAVSSDALSIAACERFARRPSGIETKSVPAMTKTPSPPARPERTKTTVRPPTREERQSHMSGRKRAKSAAPTRSLPSSVCSAPSEPTPVRSRPALRVTSCIAADDARRIASSPAMCRPCVLLHCSSSRQAPRPPAKAKPRQSGSSGEMDSTALLRSSGRATELQRPETTSSAPPW
mmetsp:Transcript_28993/g.92919  ORF Transcript_28993/g.92919 Transcript_28993/m.92919 type:complete len:288 (-) Transcript_28993:272-1135(-)